MQEVARFADVYQAEVAASLLTAHDLDPMVAERILATMQPLLQNALGGVRILVPAHQAETARDLLRRAAAGEFAEDAPEESGAPQAQLGVVFRVVTAASALILGGGYAGRAYIGPREGLSALQLAGVILLGGLIAGWVLLAILAFAGRG